MGLKHRLVAMLLATPALAGCTSDPAFWDAVAQGLDQAAYDLATQPVCTWYTDRFGVVRQNCVPAYAANNTVYVAPAPRRRDHAGHGDRGRRDDRRRDHDGDRGDRHERKGRGSHG